MKNTLIKKGIAVLSGLFLLSSTVVMSTAAKQEQNIKPVQQKAEWNIIGYFNGDNNIGDTMYGMLDLLEEEGSSDNLNFIVLYDGAENSDYKGWDKTKLIYLKKDSEKEKINSPTIDQGELDLGSPKTLEDYLKKVLDQFPAKRNMLVFFTHGYGARGEKKGSQIISLSYDETSQSGMTIEEAKQAIQNALKSKNEGKKLDALIMFTCLTNMLEFNYSFKDVTKMVVGSEDEIYFKSNPNKDMEGVDVKALINKLKQNPNISKEEISKTVIDASFKRYENQNKKDPKNIMEARDYHKIIPGGQLSSIDTEKMDEFMVYFKCFSDTLKQKLEDKETRETTVRTLQSAVEKSRKFCKSTYHDLYHLLENIENNTEDEEIRETSSKTRDFLKNKLIIYNKASYPFVEGNNNCNGLSIQFYRTGLSLEAITENLDFYKSTEFSKNTSWDEVSDLFIKGLEEFGIK